MFKTGPATLSCRLFFYKNKGPTAQMESETLSDSQIRAVF